MTSQPSPRGDLNAAVAATLNGERAAAGMTFQQLADKTGISARSLKRYLSGQERGLTVQTLGVLAVALDLPISEIIRRAEMRLGREPVATDEAAHEIVRKAREIARAEVEAEDHEADTPKRGTA